MYGGMGVGGIPPPIGVGAYGPMGSGIMGACQNGIACPPGMNCYLGRCIANGLPMGPMSPLGPMGPGMPPIGK
ncbi:hypothetical protein TELCIR_20848 [Teladorsagia circumcincta]|uniref:Uncharacterized protein n=1 Tax=Teladorsagia circumcincta TaxID=45464 RepID=A0A2G9TJN8_TELCI|nr:hypothetical protein TELCIR_20848 [Teladorsagia circumcincta]